MYRRGKGCDLGVPTDQVQRHQREAGVRDEGDVVAVDPARAVAARDIDAQVLAGRRTSEPEGSVGPETGGAFLVRPASAEDSFV
jgi:hypothetical protein